MRHPNDRNALVLHPESCCLGGRTAREGTPLPTTPSLDPGRNGLRSPGLKTILATGQASAPGLRIAFGSKGAI